MADNQRNFDFHQLEQQIASLSVGLELVMKQVAEMSHIREEPSTSRYKLVQRGLKGEITSKSVASKLVKLDFQKYNSSEDPTFWICRAKQFFDFKDTSLDDQIWLAAYHIEGDVQLWFQQFRQIAKNLAWEDLKDGLIKWFGTFEFENASVDLCNFNKPTLSRNTKPSSIVYSPKPEHSLMLKRLELISVDWNNTYM